MELAGAVSVNSTNLPWPDRVTALRPEASPASVPAARSGPMTVPLVAAFSASCSRNGTVAPLPATATADVAAEVAADADVTPSGDPPIAITARPDADSMAATLGPGRGFLL